MNRKLRFSWGHIVAFLALIFIAYVVFMGATYYTVGNYCAGLFTMGCCVLLIVLTVLGAQVLKGVDKKFHRSIIWERILVAVLHLLLLLLVFLSHIFGQFKVRKMKSSSSLTNQLRLLWVYFQIMTRIRIPE